MGLKTFTILFSDLTRDSYLRNDVKYSDFLFFSNWNLFNSANSNVIQFKDILTDDYNLFNYPEDKEYKGIPTGESYLDEEGEIKDFLPVTSEKHPGRLKYRVSNDNILISSLRLAKSPALFFEDKNLSEYVFSNGFYIFKVNKNWNKKFVHYILRTTKLKNVLDNYIYRGIGISAYKKDDLLKIKIPRIPKTIQDQIVSQIEPFEKKIKGLKKQIILPQQIIDTVFSREFLLDYRNFQKISEAKNFEIDFKATSKNDLLRISNHFHHIKLNLLENNLNDKDYWTKINTKFKLSGGKRVPKGETFSNYDTGYYYLRPTEVDFWGIDRNNLPYIPPSLYPKLKRYIIKTGEFCISIVGTLGKTSFINLEVLKINEDNLILSENFIKLIPTERINPLFYYYYFYSFIFQAQTDREYTITSIKKLGIDKWSYIKIPNITLKKQNEIADEIKYKLKQLDIIKKQITSERRKIDAIIENEMLSH